MQNLLLTAPPNAEIAAILAATAGRPSLPLLGDPIWTTVRAHPSVAAWLPPTLAVATAEADEPLPELTDALYADFYQTGNRLPFETPYFERRRRLGRVAICLVLTDESTRARLLSSFLAKLTAILDEVSWSLPAHVASEPSGKDPMQIDLFAAESAHHLAEILVVLGAVIPADTATRIRTRLRQQIFANYADREPAFPWSHTSNNWNAVCHQGVLGAALAIEDDHALIARMLTRAAAGLPRYLEGFGADGSTSEGPGYWSYGFGWFSELNAQLEHRTAGRLSLFAHDPKIVRIARFAPLLTFSNGHMVNFSDGSRTGRLSAPLLAYLGQRLDDPVLRAQGLALYRHQTTTGLNLDELRRDFFNFTRLALRSPDAAAAAATPPGDPAQPDAFFPDYGALVARGTDRDGHLWEFAAKGGNNAEHHNHNDCGSWLLNLDGQPAIIEIGAPEYTRAFFSDAQRYTFLAARSLGHSVPFVNGCEQPTGPAATAPVVTADLNPDRITFAVDLTAAYPAEARCTKLLRTWSLDKTAGSLTVTDTCEFAAAGSVESMIICQDPVCLQDGDAFITTPGVTVRVTPLDGTRITTVDTLDYRGHHGTDETAFRLRLSPADAEATSATIRCRLTVA